MANAAPRLRRSSGSKRRLSAVVMAGAVVACVPAFAVALAAPASPGGRGGFAAASKCATSGLVIWLDTAGNGAAGSIYYNLNFTNFSAHSCSLRGYPRVSAVKLSGRQVGRPAIRESAQKPSVVTLRREASATAVLRIVDAANFSASACRETSAAGLRVYPPGNGRSKPVAFPFKACSRSGVDVLSVRALVPKP